MNTADVLSQSNKFDAFTVIFSFSAKTVDLKIIIDIITLDMLN